MKKSIPQFRRILSVSAAILVSLNCAPAKILIEDDFTKPPSGVSAAANIANRQPTNGSAWAGTARIDEGVGLVADKAQSNSAAFAGVEVPQEFKKLTVKILYRSGSEQQLAFGFANTDKALRDSKGKSNMGLMWVNTMAKRANVNAGKYSSGEKIENLDIPSRKNLDIVELAFEVENPGTGAFIARLLSNEMELAARELKSTETPTFRYFFIQFRGEDGKFSNAIVENVSVEFE
jgi:hypothetical protein